MEANRNIRFRVKQWHQQVIDEEEISLSFQDGKIFNQSIGQLEFGFLVSNADVLQELGSQLEDISINFFKNDLGLDVLILESTIKLQMPLIIGDLGLNLLVDGDIVQQVEGISQSLEVVVVKVVQFVKDVLQNYINLGQEPFSRDIRADNHGTEQIVVVGLIFLVDSSPDSVKTILDKTLTTDLEWLRSEQIHDDELDDDLAVT
mmetsp:Transcript_28555/g.25499  ORF Transcript_28555/g.25499 Transcript_28555/m.25499 type:complete len:204 (+) Transcript_28555:2553-3164(+)